MPSFQMMKDMQCPSTFVHVSHLHVHCTCCIIVYYGGLLLLQDEMELAVKELDEYKELFNERNKVNNY